jgi:hypothetical protein
MVRGVDSDVGRSRSWDVAVPQPILVPPLRDAARPSAPGCLAPRCGAVSKGPWMILSVVMYALLLPCSFQDVKCGFVRSCGSGRRRADLLSAWQASGQLRG